MRATPLFLLSSAAVASAAAASPPPHSAAAGALLSALQAINPGPPAKTADRDQGDDNASLRAIQVVCSHDNPSARRSAICPVPISPF
jgi:hypothetical protein